MRWIFAWHELARVNEPAGHKAGEHFSAPPTGQTQELIALADDVYRLQLTRKLPSRLLKRLRSYEGFQGARYEIAVAATFVRCGFEVDWINDKTKKHCEFSAKHKTTGEIMAVETKSRHRPGVLHQKGQQPDAGDLKADIEHLFQEALLQAPGDRPFAIFIDVNLPANTVEPDRLMADTNAMIGKYSSPTNDKPVEFTLLVVTNFSWHYDGDNAVAPRQQIMIVPRGAQHALQSADTREVLREALGSYGSAPKDD